MRFMCMIKFDEAMPWGPAPESLYQAMGEFGQEGFRDGTLVEQGGLGASAQGAIVSLANGAITAVDGPFAEAKELIGGYAVIDVRSRAEAVELARRLLQIHQDNWPGWEGSCEIRPIFTGAGDLPPA